jgi:hypothetical protein
MLVALVYLTVLAGSALSIGFRHGPILLRGRALLLFNGIPLGLQGLFRPTPPLLWVPLFAVVFGLSWFSRNTWFIFKEEPLNLGNVIETRLQRVLVEFSRGQDTYQLSLGGQAASLRIRQLWPGLQTLTFGGSWQENKAKISRRFLGKYFDPVIPRPRFKV